MYTTRHCVSFPWENPEAFRDKTSKLITETLQGLPGHQRVGKMEVTFFESDGKGWGCSQDDGEPLVFTLHEEALTRYFGVTLLNTYRLAKHQIEVLLQHLTVTATQDEPSSVQVVFWTGPQPVTQNLTLSS